MLSGALAHPNHWLADVAGVKFVGVNQPEDFVALFGFRV